MYRVNVSNRLAEERVQHVKHDEKTQDESDT